MTSKSGLPSLLRKTSVCNIERYDTDKVNKEVFGTWAYDHICEPEIIKYFLEHQDVASLLITKIKMLHSVDSRSVLYLIMGDANPGSPHILSDRTYGKVKPVYTGELERECTRLTLSVKIEKTLENLYWYCRHQRKPMLKTLFVENEFGGFSGPEYDFSDTLEDESLGLFYGCTEDDTSVVMRYLLDKGLVIIQKDVSDDSSVLNLTPDGILLVEERLGKQADPPLAFCVCRFSNSINSIFQGVYQKVGDLIGFPVKRVSDFQHNGKIDDKIILELRRASVVIVDLTEAGVKGSRENFNVGFEAGYAIALGKPIVFTHNTHAQVTDTIKYCFDIQNYNVLQFSLSETELQQGGNPLKTVQGEFFYRYLSALNSSGVDVSHISIPEQIITD